jgi:hypothetical protein
VNLKLKIIPILLTGIVLLLAMPAVNAVHSTSTVNLVCDDNFVTNLGSCNTGVVARNNQILISTTVEVSCNGCLAETVFTVQVFHSHALAFSANGRDEVATCPGICSLAFVTSWTPTQVGNYQAQLTYGGNVVNGPTQNATIDVDAH